MYILFTKLSVPLYNVLYLMSINKLTCLFHQALLLFSKNIEIYLQLNNIGPFLAIAWDLCEPFSGARDILVLNSRNFKRFTRAV